MTRFDRIVALVVVSLALTGGLVAWRTLQVGVQPIVIEPAPGEENISARSRIRVTFDREIVLDDPSRAVSITPPVTGGLTVSRKTLVFTPDTAFAPETIYTITLHPGISDRSGTARVTEQSWQVRTRAPRILYRSPLGDGNFQLASVNTDGSDSQILARVAGNITDFDVSADGNLIAYAASLANNVTEIWQVTRDGTEPKLLLECPQALCFGMVWMPDGKRLLYQRAVPAVANVVTKPAQLWWLDIETGETVPLFQNDVGYEVAPRISPDGKWVGYMAPIDKSIVLFGLQNGTSHALPTQSYNPPVWSPKSDAVVYVQRDVNAQLLNDFLERFDLATQTKRRIDEEGEIAHHEPAWSPDSEWIAVSRSEQLSEGEYKFWQLWLVRADGSGEMQALSDDDEYFFREPSWSADGRTILFTRVNRNDSLAPAEVWKYDLPTQQFDRVAAKGENARWLP